ncbi:hypothetical protein OnM2_093036, partial [Erysiphe neolycopersici]
ADKQNERGIILLEPGIVQVTSADPSLHEYGAFELPSATIAPRNEGNHATYSIPFLATTLDQPSRPFTPHIWDTTGSKTSGSLSTTALGFERAGGTGRDL